MSQTLFATNTTPALSALDANFSENYDLRNLISTPSFTAPTPKVTLDGSGNFAFGAAGTLSARIEAVSSGDTLIAARSTGANPVQTFVQSSSTSSVGAFGTLNNYGVNFYTNSVYRASLDTSGNFLVGATSSASVNPGIVLSPNGGAAFGNNAGASGFIFQYFERSAVVIGSVSQSGTTAVLYNTTSDVRLKTAIEPLPDAGAVIDAIRPVRHEFIAEPGQKVAGFIAQELHLVVPQAVHIGGADPTEDPWGVDAAKILPFVVRELQSLRARLAAAGIA